jgi:hypothetical protein
VSVFVVPGASWAQPVSIFTLAVLIVHLLINLLLFVDCFDGRFSAHSCGLVVAHSWGFVMSISFGIVCHSWGFVFVFVVANCGRFLIFVFVLIRGDVVAPLFRFRIFRIFRHSCDGNVESIRSVIVIVIFVVDVVSVGGVIVIVGIRYGAFGFRI